MKHYHANTPLPSEPIERLAWWLAAACASLLLTCLHLTLTSPFTLASFDRLVHFTAVEPFQHRVLLPAIVAGAERLMPLGHVLLFGLLEMLFWLALLATAYRAVNCLRIGQGQALRRAMAFTILLPVAITLIAPDLRVVPALSFEDGVINLGHWQAWANYYYPYDLPAATFTLLLSIMLFELARCITRRRLVLFFAVFALATCNRETTVFLLPLTALLFYRRLAWRWLAALLLAELLVFLAVQLPLHWLFVDQPNPNRAIGPTQYENHFLENIGLFASPVYALTFFTRFAGGCLLPIILWWRYLDRRSVVALLGFVLPLILFAVVVGRVQEHRIFAEAVPLVWLAALQPIATRVGVDNVPAERCAPQRR